MWSKLGWISFLLVVVSIPFSAILFTGAAILSQFLLITAGVAAANKALLPAILTCVLYTFTAIFIAPDFFFEVLGDTTNTAHSLIMTITCINYGAFLIGLLTGFWRSCEWGRCQAPE